MHALACSIVTLERKKQDTHLPGLPGFHLGGDAEEDHPPTNNPPLTQVSGVIVFEVGEAMGWPKTMV